MPLATVQTGSDGALRWDLPAALGNPSIVLHVTLGPKP